jgi:uncharacterized membrane protein
VFTPNNASAIHSQEKPISLGRGQEFFMSESTSSSLPVAPIDSLAKKILRIVLAIAMTVIGILHFTSPEPFVGIVPQALPAPLMLVYLSGIAEIAGGVGILIPALRRAAGIGLIALYIAVFPANLNMALNHLQIGNDPMPTWALWGRLPFQIVFIAWAYWVAVARPRRSNNG